METTGKLGLKLTTQATLGIDHPTETIVAYGKNFKIIEDYVATDSEGTDGLKTGETYPMGYRVWNSTPTVGGYVGFVNIRTGTHAERIRLNQQLSVSQLVNPPANLLGNSYYYRVVEAGRTPENYVGEIKATTSPFYYAKPNAIWAASSTFKRHDIIIPPGNEGYYFQATEAKGVTGAYAPDWKNVSTNDFIQDGGVRWQKRKDVKLQRAGISTDFRPFGKIERGDGQ